MGLRGPMPALKVYTPAPMTGQDAPEWLGTEARSYWAKHRPGLEAAGVLNEATEDTFAVLCDLWGRVRQMAGSPTSRSYLDTVKAYTSLAKQFRQLPTEKPAVEAGDRHADKPEFSFD